MSLWWWIIGAILLVPAAVVFVVGKLLPVAHVARARIAIRRPVEEVWNVLTDFASYPSWRRGVSKSEPVAGDAERWTEVSPKGEAMTYETEERVPNRRLVRHITDEGLPFGGRWIFELAPDGDSETILMVTEEGEVYNPIFRFVSKFIMGHHATLVAFLEDLGNRFDQEPAVQKL